MVKFDVESDELRKVSKSLDRAASNAEKAMNVADSLDIPDFSSAKFLSGLPDKLGKLKFAIINDEEWVVNAISILESYSNDSVADIEGIEVHSYFDKSVNINVVE